MTSRKDEGFRVRQTRPEPASRGPETGVGGVADRVARRFFEMSDDICIVTDLDGVIRYVNHAWESALGQSADRVIGRHLSAFLDRDDWGRTQEASEFAIDRGSLQGFENRFLHRDGTARWIQWSIQIDHEEALAYGIGRDATEHHRLLAALRSAAERVTLQATAMDAAANAIVITDRHGTIEWVNPAFTTITGYAAEEAIGATPNLLNSGTHDEAFFRDLWETITAGRPWRGELINRRKDGTLYVEEQTITPVRGADGSIQRFIAIKQDVSARHQARQELRESEERYRMLAENATDVVYRLRLHPALSFDYVSPSAHALTGFTPEEHYADPNIFYRVVDPADQGIVRTAVGSRMPSLSTVRFHHRDGHVVHVEQHSRPILGPDGEVEALEGILRDVGQRVREQERADLLNARLETQLTRFKALHRLDTTILLHRPLRRVLDLATESLMHHLEVDAVAILRLDAGRGVLRVAASRNLGGRVASIPVGEGIAGETARTQVPITIHDADAEPDHDVAYVRAFGMRGCLAVPLLAMGRFEGALELFTRGRLDIDDDAQVFAEALAHQITLAIQRDALLTDLQVANAKLEDAYDRTIEGWAAALDLRDEDTAGHSQRVTAMALDLARRLGVADADLQHIRRGALLHDIGKMAIPDRILLKPGRLTEDEFAIIKLHPVNAYNLLKHIPYLQPALAIPHHHHERWDGTGYPDGLEGRSIPLPARIFAVVDVYDALTSDRPYRPAWTHADAIEHIRALAGSHFDPHIARAFVEMLEARPTDQGERRG